MFRVFKFFKFRHRFTGLIVCAVGVGILLTVVLPPLGWMLGCAICLIISGLIWFENC